MARGGFYHRSLEHRAQMAQRLAELHRTGVLASRTAQLNTPEARAKSIAARRAAKPPKGYVCLGTGASMKRIHRLRAERAVGHKLPRSVIVHHCDNDITNPNARLVICQDQAYHKQLHARMRLQERGADPWRDRICSRCQEVKSRSVFTNRAANRDGLDTYCAECRRIKNAVGSERRRQKKAAPKP